MPNSFSQTAKLTCPQCQSTFEAEVWLILDCVEKPELLAQAAQGNLNTILCPKCGYDGQIDTPLLLYRTPWDRLVFSPAQGTNQEQDQEQAGGLLGHLAESLGTAWKDEWLQEVATIPREILPVYLREGPEPAREKLAAEQAARMEELRTSDPEAFLQAALQGWLIAPDINKKQTILKQTPELLRPEVDDLLKQMEDEAITDGNQEIAQFLQVHRGLLSRCREMGVEEAFKKVQQGGGNDNDLDVPPQFANDLEEATAAEQDYLREGGGLPALDRAAAAWKRILEHPDFPAAPERFQPVALNDGGGIFLRRYWAAGSPADLETALSLWQRALQLTSPNSPDRPALLNNLGNGLRDRYARTSALSDLEAAIQVSREALQLTPPNSPDRPSYLNNLGVGLRARYARTGALSDLEEAIQVYREALQLTPPNSPNRPSRLNNLGNGLRDRYDRTGALIDLEEAIQVYREALHLTPPNSPNRPMYLTNLGTGLSNRYARTGALIDLEEAIQVYREALQLPPPNSPNRHMYLNNLGIGLRDRYARTRALSDLEEAIQVSREAVQLTPPNSPDRPMYLNNLGNGLSDRYTHTSATSDLEEARQNYEEALQDRTGSEAPLETRMILNGLGDVYSQLKRWQEARQTYQQGTGIAEMLYRTTYMPGGKEQESAESTGLYTGWVRACIHLGASDPLAAREALVASEAGRARTFLDQMGQSGFSPPTGVPLELAQQEAALLDQLRDQEKRLQLPGLDAGERYKITRDQANCREQLESVWNRMREVSPQAEEYVRLRGGETPTWGDLASLATALGPHSALVEFYLLGDEIAALVHRAGWEAPRTILLPISPSRLLNRYLWSYVDEILIRPLGRSPSGEWQNLGEELLAPLEEWIGDAENVCFIPHGYLHTLPLHALNSGGEPFISRRTVFYAPSAGILQRVMQRENGSSGSPLVLGYTPNSDPTERKIFLGEAIDIADHFQVDPLLDADASLDNLRRMAEGADLLHLSCHGRFDSEDAMNSVILLAGGEIRARDWMGLSLQADLVTLSACQTGFNEINPGDDIAGISRALLYAGASAVLLSLWSVNAVTTWEWMHDFYRRAWRPDRTPIISKARAFREATLELRKRYDDPYYWSPFVLSGNAL